MAVPSVGHPIDPAESATTRTCFAAVLALSLTHSPDQSLVIPHFGSVARFNRTALRGGGVEIDPSYLSVVATDYGETCFSANGDRVYAAYGGGSPHHFAATSLATGQVIQQVPSAGYYPHAVRCAWNGLVVGGAQQGDNTEEIITFHGPTGVARGNLRASAGFGSYGMTLLTRGLEVSGDATRLISLYGGPYNEESYGISIQTLPTPQ